MGEKNPNKVKMTKIPNQSDLVVIVESQIKNTTGIIDVVVRAATDGVINYSSETIDKLKSYNDVVTNLFGKDGMILTILKASESFSKLDEKKVNKDTINRGFKTLRLMQTHIKDLIAEMHDIERIPVVNFNGLTDFIDSINKLKGVVNKDDNNRPLWFKFWVIKSEINKTVKFITEVSETSIKAETNTKVKALINDIKNILKDASESLEALNAIKTIQIRSYNKKIELIKDTTLRVIAIFNDSKLFNIKTLNKINKIISNDGLLTIFTSVASIAEQISKSIAELKAISTFKVIVIKGINALADIFNSITEKFSNIKIYKKTRDNINSISETINTITDVSKKILILGAIAPFILAASVLIIGGILPAIFLTILSIAALSKLIRFVTPGIRRGMRLISGVILSLLVVGMALVGFALLTPIFLKAMSLGVLAFIGAALIMTLAIWGTFWLIGKMSLMAIPNILSFGLTIAILMATMLGAGLIILAASKMVEQIEASIGKIILMIGGMLLLTVTMVGLGIGIAMLTPYIVSSMIGWGQIIIIMGLIIGIGVTINELAKQEIHSEDAKNKTNEIISAVNLIRTELDSLEGTKKEWRQDKKVLKKVYRTVKTIVNIANNLNQLQSVTIEKDKIISNVTSIIGFTQTLQDLMNRLLLGGTIDTETPSNNTGNWFSRTVGSIFQRGAAKQMRNELRRDKKVLNKVDKVINRIVDIAEGLTAIGDMKLTDELKSTITNNITDIFGFIIQIDEKINSFMGIKVNEKDVIDAKKMNKKEWRQNKKTLSKVEATVATIQGIGESLNMIKDFKFVEGANGTKEIIIKNVGVMMSSIQDIATTINGKSDDIKFNTKDIERLTPLIDYINSLNEGFKNLGDTNEAALKNNVDNYIRLIDKVITIDSTTFDGLSNSLAKVHHDFNNISKVNSKKFSKVIDNYISFVDKVNTVEVTKLEKSAQMFQQMANFSNSIKGDFEKLAESISEELMPVLEELKNILNQIPDKLDTGFQNTSASIAATTAPITRENVTAQINRENPNLTKADVDKMVTSRLNEKAKADANGMLSKLDELMSLLRGYTGDHVVVQTI